MNPFDSEFEKRHSKWGAKASELIKARTCQTNPLPVCPKCGGKVSKLNPPLKMVSICQCKAAAKL